MPEPLITRFISEKDPSVLAVCRKTFTRAQAIGLFLAPFKDKPVSFTVNESYVKHRHLGPKQKGSEWTPVKRPTVHTHDVWLIEERRMPVLAKEVG